jgi:hypothetical protein
LLPGGRLSNFSGSAIIANDNTDAAAIVDIAATDKGFASHSCGVWTRRLRRPTVKLDLAQ